MICPSPRSISRLRPSAIVAAPIRETGLQRPRHHQAANPLGQKQKFGDAGGIARSMADEKECHRRLKIASLT